MCLWIHMAAEVEVRISNGAVCLSRLVSVNVHLAHVDEPAPFVVSSSSLSPHFPGEKAPQKSFFLFLTSSVSLFQPIESLTYLWLTSTLWMSLRFRDMLLLGKIVLWFLNCLSSSVIAMPVWASGFCFLLPSLFPVLTHTHIWISQTHATWARPFPLGPYTWPRPTRTNFGSFAARATSSKAKTAEATCSVTALDAGNSTQILLPSASHLLFATLLLKWELKTHFSEMCLSVSYWITAINSVARFLMLRWLTWHFWHA